MSDAKRRKNDPDTETHIPPFAEWEMLIRHDKVGRGLATYRYGNELLGFGELERAAIALANAAQRVAIITGFCIADAEPPAAETDGPPGALFLARALLELGLGVTLISDCYGVPLLQAGVDAWELPPPRCTIVEMPIIGNGRFTAALDIDCWVDALLDREIAAGLSDVISIERVGPSYTVDSVAKTEGEQIAAEFERATPPEHRNVPHNMRGRIISDVTAPAHRIIERIAERALPIATIGIGDGGNELGMGRYAWSVLRAAIAIGPGAYTACRIATDHTIVAGVSNWGGYALALAVAMLKGRGDLITSWSVARQRQLIGRLVEAGAVDGVSKRAALSVDGLSLDEYLRVLEALLHSVAKHVARR